MLEGCGAVGICVFGVGLVNFFKALIANILAHSQWVIGSVPQLLTVAAVV